MKVLITGAAGFVGFHLATRLLAEGHEVLGYDGMVPNYDVRLNRGRLALLREHARYTAVEALLEDKAKLTDVVLGFAPEVVVHLAAQAGVRQSIENPDPYMSSNVAGTAHLLEALKLHRPRHLLFASSSSVYGGNPEMPFRESARTDFPSSVYAATKKAGEQLTHVYSHLYGVPVTCFRFFTVYGPWGRPDMALFKFVDAIDSGKPIDVYGEGRMQRDFTYVVDLVEAVSRLIDIVPVVGEPVQGAGIIDSLSPIAPWRSVNIANGRPLELLAFVETIEAALQRRAIRNLLPMQLGDVTATWADPGLLLALTGYLPDTSIETGVRGFVDWYRQWKSIPG